MKLPTFLFSSALGFGVALLVAATGASGAQAQADAAPSAADSTDAYYYVTPDVRRCAYPHCGGVFVRKANRAFTQCPDGFYRPACYVADLEVDALGLAATPLADDLGRRQVLVRGELRANPRQGDEGLGRLIISEAWSSPTVLPFGSQVVRLQNSGIVCLTSPCPSFIATELNGTASIEIAEVQFNSCAGTDADIDAANDQLFSDDGVLAIGRPITVTGPAGEATGAELSQFFSRLVVADEPDLTEQP